MPDMPLETHGVSFVVPVRNGAPWIEGCLTSIFRQRPTDDDAFEVIVVDDGSTDASPNILARFAAEHALVVIEGGGRGAAAALNRGIAAARFPLICQVDQDVVLDPGWLIELTDVLRGHPDAVAAQAVYRAAPDASIWARVTELDLRLRWRTVHRGDESPVPVDHVCTGNTIYRKGALDSVGGLDESLGYGYDNELSYRLGKAGHALLLCSDASAIHHWKQTLGGYLRQQYGQGYGRLDLVARHPWRASGDDISNAIMILHAPAMLAVLGCLVAAPGLMFMGKFGGLALLSAGGLLLLLAGERLITGLVAARAFGDRAGCYFAPVHLLRDIAWAAAILAWGWRRLTGRRGRPEDSMGDLG